MLVRHDSPGASAPTEWEWDAVTRLCLRVATRVLGPGSAAEDAAQEAALQAWRHCADCRSPETPWPWIAAIAQREALRQRRGQPALGLDEETDAVVATHEPQTLLQLDVRRALAQLSEQERALVLHRVRARLRPILLDS